MSKKNNKQKTTNYYKFLAEKEKEITRRQERKRKKKILNKQAKSLVQSIEEIDITGNNNNYNKIGDNDIIMKNSNSISGGYVRPKKAQRQRKRQRDYILIDQRKKLIK